jgi:hypothetical protein
MEAELSQQRDKGHALELELTQLRFAVTRWVPARRHACALCPEPSRSKDKSVEQMRRERDAAHAEAQESARLRTEAETQCALWRCAASPSSFALVGTSDGAARTRAEAAETQLQEAQRQVGAMVSLNNEAEKQREGALVSALPAAVMH